MRDIRLVKVLLQGLLLGLVLFSGVLRACERTLVLGISNEGWAPYVYTDGETPYGVDIAIIEYVFEQLDICLSYTKMPSVSRSIVALEQGQIDMLMGVSYNLERDKIGRFSVPYRHEIVRIFWRSKQRDVDIKTLNTLEKLLQSKFVGTINRGSYAGPILSNLKQVYGGKQLIETTALRQRMGMLERGRVDFSIEDQLAGQHYIENNHLEDIKLHPHVVYSDDVSLLFSRKTIPNFCVQSINEIIEQHHTQINNILTSKLVKKNALIAKLE